MDIGGGTLEARLAESKSALEGLKVRAAEEYKVCGECEGRGYAGQVDGIPAPCPSCRRMRVLPVVEPRVTLPEALMRLRSELAEAV